MTVRVPPGAAPIVPWFVTVLTALFPTVSDPSTLKVPAGPLMKERALKSDPLALAGTSKVPAFVNVVAAVVALKWPKSRTMAPLLVTLVVALSTAPPNTLSV